MIADTISPTRPKWHAKKIQVVGELAGDPQDPKRTIYQFENALSVKDPYIPEKCFLMVEYYP